MWQKDQQHVFSAGLMVEATNRMGILAEIATRIAGEQSNISHVNVDSSQGDHSTILFEVQVRDRAHLARLDPRDPRHAGRHESRAKPGLTAESQSAFSAASSALPNRN